MKEDLKRAKKPITFGIDVLTENFLANLLTYKPVVLHYIGHGSQNTIALEDNCSLLKPLTAEILSKYLPAGSCLDNPKIVFINACHSEGVGKVFKRAGVKFVICVKQNEMIDDVVAKEFSTQFYRNLM